MKSLLTSLPLLLVLHACSPATTKGMVKNESTVDQVRNPYFSRTDVDHVHKASIQFEDKHFGGLMVIKKLNEQEHRVVLMGEMGNKFLDVNIGAYGIEKNFVMEEFNKSLLLNVLGKDLQLLVQEQVPVHKEYASEKQQVFLSRSRLTHRYLFFAQADGTLQSMVRRGNGKERMRLEFSGIEGGLASHITIKHLTRELTIELNRIKN